MHVLITNDDGFDAPGLTALYRALSPLADVTVVAPREEQSVCGHGVRISKPLSVQLLTHTVFETVHVVDGSPADCVRLAIHTLARQPIDWVVSGINAGANVGVDVVYSGTVAAAREAAIHWLPAIAVSQFFRRDTPINWDWTYGLTARLFKYFSSLPDPRPHVWNVTLPLPPEDGATPPLKMTRVSLDPLPLRYKTGPSDERGTRKFHYNGVYSERTRSSETDVDALFAGAIAVSPLSLDMTDHLSMAQTMPVIL